MSNDGPKHHAGSVENSTTNRDLPPAAKEVEQADAADSDAEERAENEGMPSVRPEPDELTARELRTPTAQTPSQRRAHPGTALAPLVGR